jgi:L-ascorbate metabolism protein UlaG (beta-lactamase superfamily)
MTSAPSLHLTYVGGPTALLDFDGVRLLTDPTFDPAGSEHRAPQYVLRKTQGPAIAADAIGRVDVVLLSHDHHFDNLDRAGRRVVETAHRVVTTEAGAARLGGCARGLATWQHVDLTVADRQLRITATPARHGPADGDRGPVIGFVLAFTDEPDRTVYFSGDTVWYEGVGEVSRRYTPRVAMLCLGAARVPEVGPAHLTFTAAEAVIAGRAFKDSAIVPLHFEGWAHFSESRAEIERAFSEAHLTDRLRWLVPGQTLDLSGR